MSAWNSAPAAVRQPAGGDVSLPYYASQSVEIVANKTPSSASMDPVTVPEPSVAVSYPPALVIDSGAIIRHEQLVDKAEEFYTTVDVLNEIKDEASRAILDRLPFVLKVRTPSEESVKAVMEFARKTGDLPSLSRTDLRVIALAHTMEMERVGDSYIRKEPLPPQIKPSASLRAKHMQAMQKDEKEKEKEKEDEDVEEETKAREYGSGDAIAMEEDEGEESEGSEGGWITPQTSRKEKEDREHALQRAAAGGSSQAGSKSGVKKHAVTTVTTDYAMQNVLLQMGLRLLDVKGRRIKKTSVWGRKCSACFHILTPAQVPGLQSVMFCPKCGLDTLYKVHIKVDATGMQHCVGGQDKFNLRGTIFSLPKARGGRKGKKVIDSQDTMEALPGYRRSMRNKEKALLDPFDEEFFYDGSRSSRAVKPAASDLGHDVLLMGKDRKNPNERRRRNGRKKS
jgi:RNA-binding protein NOB1